MLAHYSLYEVNQYIRRAIALNFEEAIWLSAEIAQINFSGRHAYLELWQKDEKTEEILAQASAVIWAHKLQFIRQKMKKLSDQILREGSTILIKVLPEYHERYGLKYVISDLDPSYTLGQMALERELTIQKLQEENLWSLNSSLPWPSVIQKVAVLSSPTSAGYQDFMNQLENNPHGYTYGTTLFPISVQGDAVIQQLKDQLSIIDNAEYDCVLLMRGGGSKIDLSIYDHYEVASAIARCPHPVLTAIGHQRDESITDMISAINVKTPTAASEFLIHHNTVFENEVLELYERIHKNSLQRIHWEEKMIISVEERVKSSVRSYISSELRHMEFIEGTALASAKKKVDKEISTLDHLESILKLLDPQHALDRGYSITTLDGKVLVDPNKAKLGDVLSTTLSQGSIKSKVVN